jgi:hypothetical protein
VKNSPILFFLQDNVQNIIKTNHRQKKNGLITPFIKYFIINRKNCNHKILIKNLSPSTWVIFIMVQCQYFMCSSIVCLVDLTIHASDMIFIYLSCTHTIIGTKGKDIFKIYIKCKMAFFWWQKNNNTWMVIWIPNFHGVFFPFLKLHVCLWVLNKVKFIFMNYKFLILLIPKFRI